MFVSNIEYFQISDAAAGMMRNGVIIRVRATARPGRLRSSSTANSSPNNSESTTENAVISTVATIEGHSSPEVQRGPVVVEPREASLGGVEQVPLHQREADGGEERDLGQQDEEDEGRQQQPAGGPGMASTARAACPWPSCASTVSSSVVVMRHSSSVASMRGTESGPGAGVGASRGRPRTRLSGAQPLVRVARLLGDGLALRRVRRPPCPGWRGSRRPAGRTGCRRPGTPGSRRTGCRPRAAGSRPAASG